MNGSCTACTGPAPADCTAATCADGYVFFREGGFCHRRVLVIALPAALAGLLAAAVLCLYVRVRVLRYQAWLRAGKTADPDFKGLKKAKDQQEEEEQEEPSVSFQDETDIEMIAELNDGLRCVMRLQFACVHRKADRSIDTVVFSLQHSLEFYRDKLRTAATINNNNKKKKTLLIKNITLSVFSRAFCLLNAARTKAELHSSYEARATSGDSSRRRPRPKRRYANRIARVIKNLKESLLLLLLRRCGKSVLPSMLACLPAYLPAYLQLTFEFSLCLSRACLGKMFVNIYKYIGYKSRPFF